MGKTYIGGNLPVNSVGKLVIGETVQLLENNVLVDYIVVHQGNPDSSLYDESCEGTWLLRKDIHSTGVVWNETNENTYANSTVLEWLNTTFFNQLHSSVQAVIKNAKIPYHGDHSSGTVYTGSSGLSVKAFLLSCYECGVTERYGTALPIDGSKLDYFEEDNDGNEKRIAYYNGEKGMWWTRSPYWTDDNSVNLFNDSGQPINHDADTVLTNTGCRPAIIVPSNACFVDGIAYTSDTNKVSDVARVTKKIYVGVNGVAKKIKRGYIGNENGIAKLIYSGNGLDGLTWQEISEIAQSGNASKVFSIGDTKLMYDSDGYYTQWFTATIIGFNQDEFYNTSTKEYGYSNGDKVGITFMVTPLHWSDTFKKWSSGTVTTTDYLLYSDSTAHFWMNNYNFDYDNGGEGNRWHELAPLFVPVVKYTRGLYSAINERDDVVSTKLFIPSEWEIFGEAPNSLDGNSNYPKEQYQYFKNGGSTILYDEEGNLATWWLRSDPGVKNTRCYVDIDGTVKTHNQSQTTSKYLAYCFCL